VATVRLSAGRAETRRRTRRDALLAALTAAGVPPLLPTYDLTRGTAAEKFFFERVLGGGYSNMAGDRWPCESRLSLERSVYRADGEVVYELDDGVIALASLGWGWMHVHVAAPKYEQLAPTFAAFRQAYPAAYVAQSDDPRVPITFWADSPMGPTSRLRKVDSAVWESIVGNYAGDVEEGLADLMAWENGPPNKDGGQLILWQGPPGTGKSWALRALASEWAPWAEFHYITDPDAFFVDNPSYMIQVLLADSYEAIDEPTGDIYSEQREGKWRVLILEDTGELLSATAKEKYGQGLSRLLNVVDGMIGQGLRILALVTTNDELGDLHPAVVRPGRCAAQLEFGPLSDEEAQAWTGDASATGGTLAELFARYGRERAEALALDEEAEEELSASGGLCAPAPVYAAEDTVVQAIRDVAARHADEAVGYGETAWDAATSSVLYVCGDWTDPDPIAADFLEIDGVDAFVHEAEALPEGWWDATVVYPDDPPRWVVERPDEQAAALAATVELAASPLEV